jgi:hypothetical protein
MDFYNLIEYWEATCPECGGDEDTCTCDPYMQACDTPGPYGCHECYACDDADAEFMESLR